MSQTEAHSLAEGHTGGVAERSEIEMNDGLELWVVEVRMQNRARLTVELNRAERSLHEIKDEVGPFNYELEPLAGGLSYSAALQKAQTYQEGTLETWEVKVRDEGGYFYEFYLRDLEARLWEVKITSDTGALIEKVQKIAVD